MRWTRLYGKTSICSVKLPDTARKSLSRARTMQHVHGTFMTSALGKKEARFITISTVITDGDCVGVIWDTIMWKFMYLQGIHRIHGRIDQTSTLLMSFRFSFQHTQLQQQNFRLSWKNQNIWISHTWTSRYWQNTAISQPSLDQHPLADTCTKRNDTCVSSENVVGGFAQTLTSYF